jgi:hypothetical protein
MKELSSRQKAWLDGQVPPAKMNSDLRMSKLVEDLYTLGGKVVSYTSSGTVDTATNATHDLGRVPTGYIVIQSSKAGIIYNGGASGAFSATTSTISLKCNVVSNVVSLLVF